MTRRDCAACPTGRTSGVLCANCCAAKKDKESPWDLEQAGGYWRHVRGGVKEWVPLLIETEPEADDPDVRECEFDGCGVWFMSDNSRQRYCGERCKDSAYHQRRRARDRGEVAA